LPTVGRNVNLRGPDLGRRVADARRPGAGEPRVGAPDTTRR